MSTTTVLIIVVISAIISGFLSWGILKNEKKWPLIVSAIIVGACVSYFATVNFYMHNQFNQIEELVDSYNNSLAEAKNKINSLDKNNKKITRMIFTEKIEGIDFILNRIHSSNEIIIEKSDILNIWTDLINNASHSFYASNVVPPDEWQYVNADKNYGIKPQLDAIKRGVDVKRVNLYNSNIQAHKDGINKLYNAHKEANIPSKIMSIQDIYDNFTYNSIIQVLTTEDVILVDNEILLLTHVDRDYNMKYAILCFDENRIKRAQQFFQKLFDDFPENK